MADVPTSSEPTDIRPTGDAAFVADINAAAQDALESALRAHHELKAAEREARKAEAALQVARRNYVNASAKLLPFRNQVAA